MAKRKTKKEIDEEVKAKQGETPEGWDEVGDHWEEMFIFDKDHLEIEGTFLGTAPHIGENDSNVHILNSKGIRTGIWGSSLLDTRMKGVEEGDYIMIRYIGMPTAKKSGRAYKDFKVFRKQGTQSPSPVDSDDIPF